LLNLEYDPSDNDHPKSYHSLVFKNGEVVYFNQESGKHRFSNPDTGPAVALDFYSNKMLQWLLYGKGAGAIREQGNNFDKYVERF